MSKTYTLNYPDRQYTVKYALDIFNSIANSLPNGGGFMCESNEHTERRFREEAQKPLQTSTPLQRDYLILDKNGEVSPVSARHRWVTIIDPDNPKYTVVIVHWQGMQNLTIYKHDGSFTCTTIDTSEEISAMDAFVDQCIPRPSQSSTKETTMTDPAIHSQEQIPPEASIKAIITDESRCGESKVPDLGQLPHGQLLAGATFAKLIEQMMIHGIKFVDDSNTAYDSPAFRFRSDILARTTEHMFLLRQGKILDTMTYEAPVFIVGVYDSNNNKHAFVCGSLITSHVEIHARGKTVIGELGLVDESSSETAWLTRDLFHALDEIVSTYRARAPIPEDLSPKQSECYKSAMVTFSKLVVPGAFLNWTPLMKELLFCYGHCDTREQKLIAETILALKPSTAQQGQLRKDFIDIWTAQNFPQGTGPLEQKHIDLNSYRFGTPQPVPGVPPNVFQPSVYTPPNWGAQNVKDIPPTGPGPTTFFNRPFNQRVAPEYSNGMTPESYHRFVEEHLLPQPVKPNSPFVTEFQQFGTYGAHSQPAGITPVSPPSGYAGFTHKLWGDNYPGQKAQEQVFRTAGTQQTTQYTQPGKHPEQTGFDAIDSCRNSFVATLNAYLDRWGNCVIPMGACLLIYKKMQENTKYDDIKKSTLLNPDTGVSEGNFNEMFVYACTTACNVANKAQKMMLSHYCHVAINC